LTWRGPKTADLWGIWLKISGGVSGNRETWLSYGIFRWRGSEEEAIAKAAEMNERAQRGFASQLYSPKRIPQQEGA
jgi:hypothetical protein